MTAAHEYRERFEEYSSEYLLDLAKSGDDGLDPKARSVIQTILAERGDTETNVMRTQPTSGWHRHGKEALLRLFIWFVVPPLIGVAIVLIAHLIFF